VVPTLTAKNIRNYLQTRFLCNISLVQIIEYRVNLNYWLLNKNPSILINNLNVNTHVLLMCIQNLSKEQVVVYDIIKIKNKIVQCIINFLL